MDYIELSCSLLNKDEAESLMFELAELGFDSFIEEENGFKGYIRNEVYVTLDNEVKSLLQQFVKHEKYSFQLIKSQNWNAEWEKNFEPIEVDTRCYVRASFHALKSGFDHEIIITPKMSFGTGHHATTFLVMKEMLDNNDLFGKKVLDMGCGTGILAILAAKLGASNIVAIDIDEWPCENAKENIHINKIANVFVDKGDAQILAGQAFDVILANINRNVLLEDMGIYVKCLNNNGDLLLSGFYKSDVEILVNKAESFGLNFVSKNSKDDWALLHFKK